MEFLPDNNQTVNAQDLHKQRKQRAFREYLADKGVVLALVKFLLALKQSNRLPDNPAEYLQDYFGAYRDKSWEELEAIQQEMHSLKSRADELEYEKSQLQAQIARMHLIQRISQIFRSFDPDNTGTLSTKLLVSRLSGFAKFEVDLKLTSDQFITWLAYEFQNPEGEPAEESALLDLTLQTLEEMQTPGDDGKPRPPPFAGRLDDPIYLALTDKLKAYAIKLKS